MGGRGLDLGVNHAPTPRQPAPALPNFGVHAPAVGAKISVFCMSHLVCLREGDIVQTSIV